MAVNEIRAAAKESRMKFWEYGIQISCFVYVLIRKTKLF